MQEGITVVCKLSVQDPSLLGCDGPNSHISRTNIECLLPPLNGCIRGIVPHKDNQRRRYHHL